MRSKKFYLKILLKILFAILTLFAIFSLNLNILAKYKSEIDYKKRSSEITVAPIDSALVTNIISEALVRNRLPTKTAFSILNSTVRINTPEGKGTGVILWTSAASDGEYYSYIITNRHVVQLHRTVTIEKFNYINNRIIGETSSYEGRIVMRSESRDLALIEVKAPRIIGASSQFITLEDFKKISLYDSVFVCGCSLGEIPNITNGNISLISDNRHIVTAFATFGNSGGGVFTIEGKIFGIANKISAVRLSNNQTIPEPNITRVISSFVATKWIASGKYKFILGEEYGSFDDFLEEKSKKNKNKEFFH